MKIVLKAAFHLRPTAQHVDFGIGEVGQAVTDEMIVDAVEVFPLDDADKVRRDAVDFVVRLAEAVHAGHPKSMTIGWRVCTEGVCAVMCEFVERMTP